ncbi:hypothetical protein OHA77_22015 [Streptosporangium sp. NBC_01639]|uniref:hypothetical protein n=1 Tax=Streptosporangium sp. NBC_01639 TaxID=2975948 RepID=UPI00386C2D2B|nr:hypothetical protein OHA77_22015 [Streptosporangium sp. NBC_01639]
MTNPTVPVLDRQAVSGCGCFADDPPMPMGCALCGHPPHAHGCPGQAADHDYAQPSGALLAERLELRHRLGLGRVLPAYRPPATVAPTEVIPLVPAQRRTEPPALPAPAISAPAPVPAAPKPAVPAPAPVPAIPKPAAPTPPAPAGTDTTHTDACRTDAAAQADAPPCAAPGTRAPARCRRTALARRQTATGEAQPASDPPPPPLSRRRNRSARTLIARLVRRGSDVFARLVRRTSAVSSSPHRAGPAGRRERRPDPRPDTGGPIHGTP